jgi:hypothetical protein
MLRMLLVTFFMMATNVTEISAEAIIGTLEPLEQFDGYPGNEKLGARGHVARGACFTGRWYCAAVVAGVLGESNHVPLLTPPGRPTTDERVVAIAAIDSESQTHFCLKIRREFQPMWNTEFAFRVLTKDDFCLMTHRATKEGDDDERYVVTVSLSHKTIAVEKLSKASAKNRLHGLTVDEPLGPQPVADSDLLPKEPTGERPSPLGGGYLACDEVDVAHAYKPSFLIGPGSRPGRLIQCHVIGPGQFAISERDAARERREYWLLSEAAFEPRLEDAPSKVARLYFPHVLVAPVSTFVLAAEVDDHPPTLCAITGGRLRRLWDAPVGYKIARLELSEDESNAAVELWGDAKSPAMHISIELPTGRVRTASDPHGQWDNLFVVGVTNRGDLLQDDGSSVFIRRGQGNPHLIARLIRDR